MMPGSKSKNKLQLLLDRLDIMSYVIDGFSDRTELVDEVDDSRSTVYRALNDLDEQNLIYENHGNYKPTPTGRILFKEVKRVDKLKRAVNEASPLINNLPADLLDPRVFVNATTTRSSRHSTEKHLNPIINILKDSRELYLLLPTLNHRVSEELVSHAPDMDVELIIESEFINKYMEHGNNSIEFQRICEESSVLSVNRRVPLGIAISESESNRMCIVVFHDGWIEGIISCNSEYACTWGKNMYEEFRSGATSLNISSNTSNQELQTHSEEKTN